MLRKLLIPLLLLSTASAQELKLPVEIKIAKPGSWFIVAPEVVSGGQPKWRVDTGLEEQRLDALFELPPGFVQKGKIFSGDSGRYKIEVWNAKGDVPSDIYVCWVTIGPAVPPPPPGPGPDPTPVPTPAGLRTVLIFHETGSKTPAWTSAQNLLRSGPANDYLASKGHTLYILDEDSLGGDGKPSPIITKWQPTLQGLARPVMVIYDNTTKAVVHKQSLPAATVTATQVVDILKAHGG